MQKYILILIFSGLFITSEMFSQDFEVSPVVMDFIVDPGESQTKILSVKNHSNFKMPFTITFADFVVDNQGNKISMKRNSTKNSCAEWITAERTFFDINPNEQVDLKITMEAPSDDMKARWALMYVQTAKVKSTFEVDEGVGAGISVSGRISVQVFRNPTTALTPDVSIKYLKELEKSETGERSFTATVENTGSSIAKCKIMFIAADLKTGEEFEFDPIYIESYPGFPREVLFKLPINLPPGEYSFVALLDFGTNTTIKGTRLKETLVILDKENQE